MSTHPTHTRRRRRDPPGHRFRHGRKGFRPGRRPPGIELGRHIKGAETLWVGEDGEAVLPSSQLRRQVLMVSGNSIYGRDHVVSRVIEGVAREGHDAQIVVFDGNADPGLARHFGTAMFEAGRTPLFFPEEKFDGWAGDDWRSVFTRLLAALSLPRNAAAAYHTDAATVILELAFRMHDRPPSSSHELLERLNFRRLLEAYPQLAEKGVEISHIEDTSLRCRALFAHFGSALDGEKSFIDVDAAYFSFDRLVLGRETGATVRLLLSQLLHYLAYERDPTRPCVVVASSCGGSEWVEFCAQAPRFGAATVLCCQTLLDFGSPAQAARVVDNCGTYIAHGEQAWREIEEKVGPAESVEPRPGVSMGPKSRRFRRAAELLGSRKISREDLFQMPDGQMLVVSGNAGTLVESHS